MSSDVNTAPLRNEWMDMAALLGGATVHQSPFCRAFLIVHLSKCSGAIIFARYRILSRSLTYVGAFWCGNPSLPHFGQRSRSASLVNRKSRSRVHIAMN